MKSHKKSLFIFRRDLRLIDNSGLISALENSEQVLPIFIFDDRQTDREKNEYFSENAFQFMVNSIGELEQDLESIDIKNSAGEKTPAKLHIFHGSPNKIIESLISNDAIDAVFVNRDYTPFSVKRDSEIQKVCEKNGVAFNSVSDYTLSPIEKIETGQGKKYSIFTPFKNRAKTFEVAKPVTKIAHLSNYFSENLSKNSNKFVTDLSKYKIYNNQNILLKGGRSEALSIIKTADKNKTIENYEKNRDFPAISGTSQLSAHIKFGTVSIREIYHWAKDLTDAQTFISELYWRDFYLYIALHFPSVFGKSFQDRGDKIKWINDKKHFEAWKNGQTGVPIVDAGMRQLNTTGWMHNRVRMIVASYLTKNLLIDWRWGEKYFAQKLIDYDPSSNNGGWQWSASVGADPRPLRIFNPETQAEKFDPNGEYIKKWVPELRTSDGVEKYPRPLVDQKESFHRAMMAYRAAKQK